MGGGLGLFVEIPFFWMHSIQEKIDPLPSAFELPESYKLNCETKQELQFAPALPGFF